MAKYNRAAEISYNTDEVFAAACAAHRVNGGYLKIAKTDEEGNITDLPNKNLISQFLEGKFDIRDEDRVLAEQVRTYVRGFTFKILQGKKLSDFQNTALELADSEEISGKYHLAIVSSLPEAYMRHKRIHDIEYRLRMVDGIIDHTNKKIELNIEVVKCFYSENYGKYYVTAITDDNKAVFFGYQYKFDVGATVNIVCKFKEYREEEKLNKITHVKLV
jgi:hypothetical protein